MEYFANYALTLFNNGYQPIPIEPGTKAPKYNGWSKETGLAPVQQHITKHPTWGVGISNQHASDVDIADKAISRAILFEISKIDPACMVRIGQAPRFLVPINKLSELCTSSTIWYDPALYIEGGTTEQNRPAKNQIEFLKAGSKQFVAYAIHPGTGKEYTWHNGRPLEAHADSLRTWTAAEILSLYALFDSLCEARGFIKGSGKACGQLPPDIGPIPDYVKKALTGSNDMQTSHEPTSLEKLTKLVYALPVDQYLNFDYHTWNNVGMAIHAATKGSNEGFLLFDTWSATGNSYLGQSGVRDKNGADNCTLTKWNSYSVRPDGQGLGIGSIYHWLQEAGVPIPADTIAESTAALPGASSTVGMTLDVADRRFMYLEMTNEIGDFDTFTVIPYANKKRALGKYDHLAPGKAASKSFLDTWTKREGCQVGQREWFRPVKDTPIIHENGLSYFNSYNPPVIRKVIYDPAVIEPVLDHIRFIIPEPVLFEAFLDWVAHKWMYPWEKSFVFLIITSSHQTGKGVILALLKRIFGYNRIVPAPPSTFTDKASQFNEFLDGSIFNFCDEAKFDAASYDTLKSWVYEPYLSINKKNGFKGTAETFSSWLVFSNHLDSAVIGPEDVRLAVSIMRDLRKTADYYENIFNMVNDPSQEVVAHFVAMLEARDLSKFKRHEAPWSKAKDAMVRSSKNDLEYLISSMIDDGVGPCKYDITSARLVAFYIERHTEGHKVSVKAISQILERMTALSHLENYFVDVTPHPQELNPLVNSRRQKGLICVRNYGEWKGADNVQFKLEYLRSREAAITPVKTKEEINNIQFKDLKEA